MATSTKSSSSTPLRLVAALLLARLASAEVASDRATVELSENATTTLLANTEEDPPFYLEAQKAYNLIENVLNRKCYDKKATPPGNPQVRGVKYAGGGGGAPASDDVAPASDDAGDETAGDNGGDNSNDGGDGGAPAPAPAQANVSASMIQSSSKRSPEPGEELDPRVIGDTLDNAPSQDDEDDGGSQVQPAATPAVTPADDTGGDDTGGGAAGGDGWDHTNQTSIKDIPEKDSEKDANPVVVAQIVPRSCENNKEILEALRPLVEQRLAEAKEALKAVKEQDAALQAIIEKEKTAAANKKAKLEAMALVIEGVVKSLTAFPTLAAFGKDEGAIIVDPNPNYHGATGGTGGDAVDTAGDDTGGGAAPATPSLTDDQSADQDEGGNEDDSAPAPGTPGVSM